MSSVAVSGDARRKREEPDHRSVVVGDAMITVQFSCAACGKDSERFQFSKSRREFVPVSDLVSQCLPDGWVAQENWPHLDVYCSARCGS